MIDYIEVVLENLEAFIIRNEHIRTFVNSSDEQMFFHFSSEANRLGAYTFTFPNNYTLPFERMMKCNDIASFKINYKNGKHKNVYVKWAGENDDNNPIQSNFLDENGDIYIAISEKTTAKSFFYTS